jgi:hypothetical protein
MADQMLRRWIRYTQYWIFIIKETFADVSRISVRRLPAMPYRNEAIWVRRERAV